MPDHEPLPVGLSPEEAEKEAERRGGKRTRRSFLQGLAWGVSFLGGGWVAREGLERFSQWWEKTKREVALLDLKEKLEAKKPIGREEKFFQIEIKRLDPRVQKVAEKQGEEEAYLHSYPYFQDLKREKTERFGPLPLGLLLRRTLLVKGQDFSGREGYWFAVLGSHLLESAREQEKEIKEGKIEKEKVYFLPSDFATRR